LEELMNLTLTGRHFEITPYLKAHVDDKVKKLSRFNDHISETEIVLFKDSIHDVAEGKIHMSHTVLTAKGQGPDMYVAVNDLVDKLVAQMQRHDGRLRDRKRHGAAEPT
jgi:putative sigma-54 modulation protein